MLNDTEYKIKEATLLSVEEYEKYQSLIPFLGNWWWLRSPGLIQYCATHVNDGGGVSEAGHYVTYGSCAVRPALYIEVSNPENFRAGDKIDLQDKKWTVLDVFDVSLYILCDDHIGYHRFDSKSNNWETSELKGWLEEQFSIKKNISFYALEVYEKEGGFIRQIDVLESPQKCFEMAEGMPNECLDSEDFHITEIVYELLSDGSIGEELEISTDRLIDCLPYNSMRVDECETEFLELLDNKIATAQEQQRESANHQQKPIKTEGLGRT